MDALPEKGILTFVLLTSCLKCRYLCFRSNPSVMTKHMLTTLFIFLSVISCRDEAGGPDDPIDGEPSVTEIGIPIDNAATAQIGSSGGSLSSEDGKLTIAVPANAVNTNTTFSIQPIIGFCPGGTAAFRLLPEGLTFSTPVTLTFHYTTEEMEGTSPEFLGIAYQGTDKIWYRLPAAVMDASAKTISVPVKHFTDWSVLDRLSIEPHEPAIPEVKTTETLSLHLDGAEDLPPLPSGPSTTNNPSPNEDELPPLPPRLPFQAKWYVNGVLNGNATFGRISQDAGSPFATYTAPENVPANNPVQVSAELTRFRFWDRVNGRMMSFNDVILFKNVRIKPNEYNFKLELEAKTDHACGLAGQLLSDRFEMNIKVQHGMVTVSDTANHAASITPTVIGFPGGCTLTCIPGRTGIVNVKEVQGTVSQGSKGETLFLTLKYKDATTNEQTIECPDANPSYAPSTTFESSISFEFLLKDSTQMKDDGPNGYWVKLTPR